MVPLRIRNLATGCALVLGPLATACSSGGHHGTPDPCELVTRQEVAAALHDRIGTVERSEETIDDFSDASGAVDSIALPSEPGTRKCTFKATRPTRGMVEVALVPDKGGAAQRQRKGLVVNLGGSPELP